jgi:exodeoxyribonuclease V alpha subunit
VFERIIFHNAENHYCVGELRLREGRACVTIAGVLPNVQCGETLEIDGAWQEHPQYGRQFKVSACRSTLPSTVYGIRKYLGSGLVEGIGRHFADKIVDRFGVDTLRVIEEDSGRLRLVDGIGPKRARQIKQAWDEQRSLREVMVFLQTYGVGVAHCLRLVKRYGNQTSRILREDPYLIAREIDGIGFRTADQIARNLGFANDSPERIDAGLYHLLKAKEDDGHTGFPPADLAIEAATLLEADLELVRARLAFGIERGLLHQSAGSPLLQLPGTERAEARLAARLGRLLGHPGTLPPIIVDKAIDWAQDRSGFAFADEQKQALAMGLRHKVAILTGGPGTGKTTIMRALCQILLAKEARLLLASPTGRAAQRLAESTGLAASTIHRLLKFDPQAGGFTHDERNPLRADYIVIDEASMLDNSLAAALLAAIPPSAHLLLVGDVHQLPSVGAGNVLRDLIDCGLFAVTRLEQIFRQHRFSGIVTTAHGILHGEAAAPFVTRQIDELDPRGDLHFLAVQSPAQALETVLRLLQETIPRHFPRFLPLRDVQVLAPMHRGIAGIANLNAVLQKVLNPGRRAITLGMTVYQEGDKVIQTRNNYDKGVFNGDPGFIHAINPEAGTLAVDFDGRVLDYKRNELADLALAYAITIHKSQGSEFPAVIIPLLKQHYMLLQRNLLYTAVTRGRRQVFVVGEPAAWAMAVHNAESRHRHTDLGRKLTAAAEGR